MSPHADPLTTDDLDWLAPAVVDALRPTFEAWLAEAVAFPTVSLDASAGPEMEGMARWAAERLRAEGAEAEVFETAGWPVVVGTFRHPRATRTVTLYHHLDVQPANEPEWRSDPFRMTIEPGGVYRGRGTTDDKGPALAALLAVRLLKAADLPLNIRFVWELEEEIGSPNFEAFLAEHRERLATDSVLVSDTVWLSAGKPAAPVGLRGMLGVRLLLETGTRDAHSGLVGGVARNPLGELCQLISEIYEARTGQIRIPGFHDEVRPLDDEQREQFVASGFDAGRFQAAHGLTCLRTHDPREMTERLWARPTFEVHGLVGGYMGPGLKAIVPPRAEAKVSMRLVPDQHPETILERLRAFVAERAPDVRVEAGGMLEPFLDEPNEELAGALRVAMRFGFGADPAWVREGASIGAVVQMQRQLGCPILFLGLSLPEHGYHAPNECFDWHMASGGIRALGRYLVALAGPEI